MKPLHVLAGPRPWWRAYSEHPPTIYNSVRAPLHEAFARAVEAYSQRVRPHGLGCSDVIPTSWTRRDAKDAALDAFDRLGQQTTRGG